MRSDVVICGAGQLGSRYLQGLARVERPLSIYVQDTSSASLRQAESRWLEAVDESSPHRVTFASTLEMLPDRVDVAIVATTADVRPDVVDRVAQASHVRFWVLEKVLAQSEQAIREIEHSVRGARGAWVNMPRRENRWHQEIKAHLSPGTPMALTVTGGMWGLACNGLHFLDLLQWWSGETLTRVDTSDVKSDWAESKRPGNWEAFGTLVGCYSGGSIATLTVDEGTDPLRILLQEADFSWELVESQNMATRSDGLPLPGSLRFQSELTAGVVEALLGTGTCGLPQIAESAALHRLFLRGLLKHWQEHRDRGTLSLPIT